MGAGAENGKRAVRALLMSGSSPLLRVMLRALQQRQGLIQLGGVLAECFPIDLGFHERFYGSSITRRGLFYKRPA